MQVDSEPNWQSRDDSQETKCKLTFMTNFQNFVIPAIRFDKEPGKYVQVESSTM